MPNLISVLIPAYNHEQYVEECVNSVVVQDWPRMELLIVDDGSKDGTWDKVRALAEKARQSGRFERVEIAKQENRGTCATWNRLCEMARGDVIAMIASDDKYLPSAFSSMMSALLSDNRIGVVLGRNELMDADGRRCYWDDKQGTVHDPARAKWLTFTDYLAEKTGVGPEDDGFGDYERLVRGNHIPNGYLIRAEFLRQVLPFRQEAPLEDWWLHLQLSKICQYKCIGDHTFAYRWHAGNSIKHKRRMAELSKGTIRWEADTTATLADPKWHELVVSAWSDRKCLWGVGSFLWDERVREIDQRYHMLHIFGFQVRH